MYRLPAVFHGDVFRGSHELPHGSIQLLVQEIGSERHRQQARTADRSAVQSGMNAGVTKLLPYQLVLQRTQIDTITVEIKLGTNKELQT